MRPLLSIALLVGFVAPSSLVRAQVASEIENLTVVSHHFTTVVSSSRRTLSVQRPDDARYMILLMRGDFPSSNGRLFTYDFVLRYRRGGNEDRSGCRAIAPGHESGAARIGGFRVGYGSFISTDSETRYFGLACFIEEDVDEVEIFPLGSATPLRYSFSDARPYSVFITTNQRDILAQAQRVIEAGGYQVQTSERLTADTEGVTIHYRPKAESHAREISQRLIAELGLLPTVKEMDLVSKYDVVVWLGR